MGASRRIKGLNRRQYNALETVKEKKIVSVAAMKRIKPPLTLIDHLARHPPSKGVPCVPNC